MKKLVTLVSPGGKEMPLLIDEKYVCPNGYSIKCEECACEEVNAVIEDKKILIEDVTIEEVVIEKPKKKAGRPKKVK